MEGKLENRKAHGNRSFVQNSPISGVNKLGANTLELKLSLCLGCRVIRWSSSINVKSRDKGKDEISR